ncbi:protein disulfide isomerase EPS1 PWA37_000420 [Arxiozyma heterogenica]|uniref:Thioredoxin domain-containing protein n=1 Tax=Arxiozyma heterogenica TaxID=278026 RepID=A0AAN7WJZ6_9SACH|nr:hypothetical protein RI543_003991 [Kazachstania heterogenica]
MSFSLNSLLTKLLLLQVFYIIVASTTNTGEEYPDFPEPLTKTNFNESLSKGLHIVEFYSPYCSHCKHLEPIWKETWKQFQKESHKLNIYFNQVNCVESGDLCHEENIEAFPTIRLYNKDGVIKTYPSNGERSVAGFLKFARNEAKNPDNFDEVGLNSKSIPLSDVEFVDMISGKSNEPYLVSFWPTEDMTKLDSKNVEFFDCEECNAFIRTWKQVTNKLSFSGIKTGHLNCVKYPILCKHLGYSKLSKKYTFDDDRRPAVAMILPNKTTNNLFKYNHGYSLNPSDYQDFAESLFENNLLSEISKAELLSKMRYKFDFKKDSIIPIDEQTISVVFVYDPKTVVPEDYDVFEYLLEPLSKFPNIRLYQSNDDIMKLPTVGYYEFNKIINYNFTEGTKSPNEEYLTMATLTQLPTLLLFKDGDLIPKVFHGYSTTEMRNPNLIMKWIEENSLPLFSKVDSSNIERLIDFQPELYNSLSLVCVQTKDDPSEKEKKNMNHKKYIIQNFLISHYDYDNVRMNYMFEKILKRRQKKDAIVKALREKQSSTKKVVAAMRYEILHEDNLQNILGYVDLHDVSTLIEKLTGQPFEGNLKEGDVLLIDKTNRQLHFTKISGDIRDSNSPYVLKENLLSINIPEKSQFRSFDNSLSIRIGGKKQYKNFGKSFIIVIGLIVVIYFIIPRIVNIIKQIKRNRNYDAKRDTIGLLGNFEKQSIHDKYK